MIFNIIGALDMIDTKHLGGLFSIGLYGCDSLTDRDKELLTIIQPSGVILFQRNIKNPEQIKKLINEIKSFLGYKPLVSIDQEGGIVSRLTEGFTVSPGAMALSRTNNPENSYIAGKILGLEMKAVGIDWDLAPVVDINNNPDNPGIGIRSFGETREIVTAHAKEFVRGLGDEGIISCLKHFPGKGRVTTDAHLDMPELEIDKDLLFHDELYPYINIEAPSWMPSHVYYPALQSVREPSSVSKEILTDLVRGELGYKGVLISDDMTMGGIIKYYSVAEGVKKSFYAGMDNILICHDFEKQLESFNVIKKEIESNETAYNRMVESIERNLELFKISNKAAPSLDEIHSTDHIMQMKSITDDCVEILKNEDNAIPMKRIDLIYSIELARKVEIEDIKDPIPPAVTALSKETGAPINFITDKELKDIDNFSDTAINKKIVLFTENAHLDSSMEKLIKQLSEKSEIMTVCALRNPYDKDIDGVKNIICSYGYTKMQQERIVDLLTGK